MTIIQKLMYVKQIVDRLTSLEKVDPEAYAAFGGALKETWADVVAARADGDINLDEAIELIGDIGADLQAGAKLAQSIRAKAKA